MAHCQWRAPRSRLSASLPEARRLGWKPTAPGPCMLRRRRQGPWAAAGAGRAGSPNVARPTGSLGAAAGHDGPAPGLGLPAASSCSGPACPPSLSPALRLLSRSRTGKPRALWHARWLRVLGISPWNPTRRSVGRQPFKLSIFVTLCYFLPTPKVCGVAKCRFARVLGLPMRIWFMISSSDFLLVQLVQSCSESSVELPTFQHCPW